MQEHLITVAEAARQIGVSERTLRRILHEPEQQAKLRVISRQIRGRVREVAMVPPALLAEMMSRFAADHSNDEPATTTIRPAQEAYVGKQTGITFTAGTLVLVYQRLVMEKDSVIQQQAERIADLQRAIDHERDQSRRAQQNALRRRAAETKDETVMISTSLHSELRKLFEDGAPTVSRAGEQPASTGTSLVEVDTHAGDQLAALNIPPATLVKVYEWTLKDKDAIIEQQHQRINDLLVSLDHERDQCKRAQLFFEVTEPLTSARAEADSIAPRRTFWQSLWGRT